MMVTGRSVTAVGVVQIQPYLSTGKDGAGVTCDREGCRKNRFGRDNPELTFGYEEYTAPDK